MIVNGDLLGISSGSNWKWDGIIVTPKKMPQKLEILENSASFRILLGVATAEMRISSTKMKIWSTEMIWLVVWNIWTIFPYIGKNNLNWRIHIFQRCRAQPPTSDSFANQNKRPYGSFRCHQTWRKTCVWWSFAKNGWLLYPPVS